MILAVLKVIGIVLLVLLGILLALVLLILFLPVRYRVRFRKEDDPFQAEADAGWLFHLVFAEYRLKSRSGVLKLKLFGKVLKTFHIPKGETPDETGQDPGGGRKKPGRRKGIGNHKADAQDQEKGAEKEEDRTAKPGWEEKAGSDKDPVQEEGTGHRSGPESGPEEKKKGREQPDDTLLWQVITAVLKILQLPSDAPDEADRILRQLEKKAEEISDKAEPFVSQEAFALYGRLLRYLGRFLSHCRIRRLDGYLLVGTGHPDLTGELVGLLYLVQPDAGGSYDLQADFYREVFRTQTSFCGHIRLNHAAAFLVRLLRDKEFRKLMAHIRHKDGKKKTRRKKSSRSS